MADTHTCKCPNRHLLDTGDVCELCLGVVKRPEWMEEFRERYDSDPFDELYFEELESYFDDVEYAA